VPSWAGFIRGQVRYDDQRPADHVILRLRSDQSDVQTEMPTDLEGKFNFDGLPLSIYHLTIEGQGFVPYSSYIDISMSKMAYEMITLRLNKDPDAKVVPPEGPKGSLNARIAQIPPEAHKEFDLGKQSMHANDHPGSLQHFQKAINLYANYAEAYQLMGVVNLEIGKFADAEPQLAKATEIEPRLTTAFFALGICRNQMARYADAETALARGLELDPNSADGHYHIAEAYWNLGRFDDSEPHARKSLELKPDMAPAHVLLGNSMLRKRDAPGALREFREYLRLAPQGEFATATRAAVDRLEKGLNQAKNPK
jgi:tetratricopeptide (TPR) repeat protein